MNDVRSVYYLPGQMAEGNTVRWYVTFLMRPPYLFVTVPASLGLIWMLRDRKREGWMITAFVAVYLGVFSMQDARWPRVLIPLLPFVAIAAGYFIAKLSSLFSRRLRTSAGRLTFVLTLVMVIAPVWSTIGHAHRFTHADVRALTYEWIVQNIPSGSKIATDLTAPILPPGRYQVDRVGWDIVDHDVTWYQEQGYEYVVVSGSRRNNPNRTVEKDARYETFPHDSRLSLMADIEGPLLSYSGYHMWVYQLEPIKDD